MKRNWRHIYLARHSYVLTEHIYWGLGIVALSSFVYAIIAVTLLISTKLDQSIIIMISIFAVLPILGSGYWFMYRRTLIFTEVFETEQILFDETLSDEEKKRKILAYFERQFNRVFNELSARERECRNAIRMASSNRRRDTVYKAQQHLIKVENHRNKMLKLRAELRETFDNNERSPGTFSIFRQLRQITRLSRNSL